MRRLALLCLSFVLLAGAACAREGDADPCFSGDGQYTISFDVGTSKQDKALRTLVDSQGRYVMVGYADPGRIGLTRLLPDGSPDPAYAGGGAISYPLPGNATLTDAVLGPSDSVIVVGYGWNPLDNDPFICRYNANGVPDVPYGTNGCHFLPLDYTVNGDGDDRAYAVTVNYYGDVYLAGSVERNDAGDYDFLVMDLLPFNGQPRTTFGNNGAKAISFDVAPDSGGDDDRALAILAVDSSLYVGGYANVEGFNGTDFAIAKLSALGDGALDTTFCADAGSCSGSFKYAGRRTFSFAPAMGIVNERIGALAVHPSGSITVAGESDGSGTSDVLVTYVNGATGNLLNPAGNEGNRTRITLLAETRLGGLAVQQGPRGQIIVAGTTATAPGNANPQRSFWVAQLLSTLGFDNNFATSGGGSNWVQSFVFDKNGTAQPMDHAGGSLAIDNHARILLTGSRLWERNTSSGLDDFDYAIVRMQGDAIFVDGFGD